MVSQTYRIESSHFAAASRSESIAGLVSVVRDWLAG
jgi:hypothetical protein